MKKLNKSQTGCIYFCPLCYNDDVIIFVLFALTMM